jgi:hypothetical protein
MGKRGDKMKRGQAIEAIAALVDGLRALSSERWGSGGRHVQAQNLLDLAEELRAILVPVKPSANFRRRLHGDLILKAQSQRPRPVPVEGQQLRTGILLGAAALGSLASVAGLVIAYVLHNRNLRATNAARG